MTGDNEGYDAIVAEINVTPLIDVFLVMVVIFMVSALAVQSQCEKCEKRPPPPTGVVLRLPPGDQHDLDPARPALALDVALDGPVRIAGKAFSDAELAAVFARTTKQTRVILRADRGVPHGRVVDIIERARRAGLSEIGIATAGRR